MDDVHGNTRLPGKPYEEIGQWTLTLPPYDTDNVVEPLQEACLECSMSNPLGFFPPLLNLQCPIMALEPPILVAEWEKYQVVDKAPRLCHQKEVLKLDLGQT
jgi:hypothetical protein